MWILDPRPQVGVNYVEKRPYNGLSISLRDNLFSGLLSAAAFLICPSSRHKHKEERGEGRKLLCLCLKPLLGRKVGESYMRPKGDYIERLMLEEKSIFWSTLCFLSSHFIRAKYQKEGSKHNNTTVLGFALPKKFKKLNNKHSKSWYVSFLQMIFRPQICQVNSLITRAKLRSLYKTITNCTHCDRLRALQKIRFDSNIFLCVLEKKQK